MSTGSGRDSRGKPLRQLEGRGRAALLNIIGRCADIENAFDSLENKMVLN